MDVVVPVRAPAPWLSESLYSVGQQTMNDWRLLIVMDGYSEAVQEVCDTLPQTTPLRVEVLPPASGLVSALNHGIATSDAEFVARLDADDVCRPNRFARQLEYLRAEPNCLALGTGIQLINEIGVACGSRAPRHPGSVLRTLRWRSAIAHPSVMMRREAILQVGGYSSQALYAEDFDLWLRLAALGEIHAIPDQLLMYRIHAGQVTSKLSYPDETLGRIAQSRIALARARGESLTAARVRQMAWAAVNSARGR